MSDVTRVLGGAGGVLLDFDGPVTPLMPAPVNSQAADLARDAVIAPARLTDEMRQTTDHLAVLRFAATLGPNSLERVEEACIRAEVAAAETSQPTPGGHEFIRAVRQTDRPLAIVSNNAAEAVHAYLRRFGLATDVYLVVGREPLHPDRMKPRPHLLLRAAERMSIDPSQCVLVGDALTDVAAARTAGMPCIGYAKSADRVDPLRRAGAVAVVRSMTDLAAVALPS